MTIEEANKELLPCPFCGVIPSLFHDTSSDYESQWSWQVECFNEQCEKFFDNCTKAIEAWNTRAGGWKRLSDEKPKDGQECLLFKSHCYWVGTWFEDSQEFSGGVQSDLWMPIPLAPENEG